jgi:hypothetical protein
MNALIAQLDLYFGKKAPQLPAGVKEAIVKYSPYLIIISLIFLVISLMSLFAIVAGYGALFAAGIAGGMTRIWISLIIAVTAGIIQLMALPGLFKRTPKSWTLIFYAEVVMLIGNILSIDIVGFIVSAIVGFYILFQIMALYNGVVPASPASPASPTTPLTP